MPTKGKFYQRIGSFLTALVLTISGTSIAWPVFFSEKAAASNYQAVKLIANPSSSNVELNKLTSVARITVSAVDKNDQPIEVRHEPAYITATPTGGEIQVGCTGEWSSSAKSFEFHYNWLRPVEEATATFCYRGKASGAQTIDFTSYFDSWLGTDRFPELLDYPIMVNEYTAKFMNGSETVSSAVTVSGSAITVPTDPTKTGYTFNGWGPVVPATMPESNQTFVALWDANSYTVTFDSDGGSEVASITQDYNTEITAPANPTKNGYTFTGWSPTIPETMPVDGASLKAQWGVNSYTATFDSDGGSEVASITQDYGTPIIAPSDPVKIGYTFDGWDNTIPATMPAENQTFVAQWIINKYTIMFDTDGGTPVDSITQDYNTAVTAPVAPTKLGYTFDKWDSPVPDNMPVDGASLKAIWTINSYGATFSAEDVITAISVNFGEAIDVPADPVKPGYTFTGWTPIIPDTMPAEDVAFVATWIINNYNATFDVDAVLTIVPTEFGSIITVPADPLKTGYTFTGWSPIVPATMPAENMTFVAQWTANVVAPVVPPVVEIPVAAVTAVAAVDVTPEVLGTATEEAAATSDIASATGSTDVKSDDPEVKSATDKKDSGWDIMGLAWYWWLIIVALAASIWWFIAARRRTEEDQKPKTVKSGKK